MMWSSKLFFAAAMASSMFMSVSGHAIIAADQATLDGLSRGDVTRGSTQKCSNFAGAGTATIQNGVVNLVAKNFNGGKDGSTFFSAALSTTGRTGDFTAVDVTKNGEQAPSGTGDVPISVAIPADADCSAGCTLALNSAGNFGNCVDLAPTDAAAGTGAADTTTDTTTTDTTGTDTTTTSAADASTTTTATTGTTGTGKGRGRGRGRKAAAAKAAKAAKAAAAAQAAAAANGGAAAAGGAAALKLKGGRVHSRDFLFGIEDNE